MNVKRVIFISSLCVMILLSSTIIMAASSKITGIVVDKSTGEPLPGANIIIKETVIGAATDIFGNFVISNVNPGMYTLSITYIGFKDAEKDIMLKMGETLDLVIELEFAAVQAGEAVVVLAQAEGQIKAINQQLASNSFKNIVSEARIKELPDANAAEALGRLPGVTIVRSGGEASEVNVRGQSGGSNAYFVEGMRMVGAEGRGVGLANISSSMIGGIELQKTFMPDQDGDITGGGIVFRLKEADPGFKGDVILRQGYNGLTKSFDMRDASVTLSNRFYDNKLGVLANVVYDQKDRSVDGMSAEYDNYSLPINTDDLTGHNLLSGNFYCNQELRTRVGLTYNVDYKIPNHKILWNGFYAHLNRDYENFYNSIGKLSNHLNYGGNKYIENEKTFLTGLKGEHFLFNSEITWGASHSFADLDIPDMYSLPNAWEPFSDVVWAAGNTASDMMRLVEDQNDLLDATVYSTRWESQKKNASENSFYLNVKVPFSLNQNIAGYVKFGGKYRGTKRDYTQNVRSVKYAIPGWHNIEGTALIDSLLPDMTYVKSPTSHIFSYANFGMDETLSFSGGEGDLDLYYPINWDVITKVIDIAKDEYLRDYAGSTSNNYKSAETYAAAYIMAGINIGPYMTFTPGVRFEKFKNTTDAFRYVADPSRAGEQIEGDLVPVTDTNKNDYWLPMVTLKIKPLNWLDIRTSATKTLIRPEFLALSPRFRELADCSRNFGNPDLKPAISQNYDLYMSVYHDYVGLVTVGGFYKNIKDEAYQLGFRVVDLDDWGGLPEKYLDKTFTTYVNNPYDNHVKGLEIDWQTTFWYLPFHLDGLVFNVNYTLLKTRLKRPAYYEVSKTLPYPPYRVYTFIDSFTVSDVLGSPDQTVKLALGYEKQGFSGRVSLFYQTRAQSFQHYLYNNMNVATDELYRWDVQLSQKINKNITCYMNMNNIGSWADQSSMMYAPDNIVSISNYGFSMDVGLRYRF